MNSVIEFPRSLLEREIAGALASAIDAHGPVTRENRAPAAKRVVSALRNLHRAARKELTDRIIFGGAAYERVVPAYCTPVTAANPMLQQMIEDAEWRAQRSSVTSPTHIPAKETR